MAGQLGFADGFVHPGLGGNRKLDAISDMVDWSRISALVSGLRPPQPGRPSYDPAVMMKALLLGAFYDLSDPGLEEALCDRLSFRRFCGLGLGDATPDETTLCRFRGLCGEHGIMEAALEELNRQLDAAGLIMKRGTLMDATIIPAAHNPPPISAGAGATHPREAGANWTKKNGKYTLGYKLHIGMDEGSGLVRKALVTGAKTYESEVADDLISWDEAAVYGDKAYPKKSRRAALKAHGIKDRIAYRRHKSVRALPPRRQHWNDLVARRRAPVEAVFSAGKRLYGMARATCHSIITNTVRILAFIIVYNLRRATIVTAI